MRRHDFGYFFREGLSNMFSHGFMSFAAIGITVACLLIMGTFTLVAVNADANLRTLEQENEIVAFVEEDLTDEEAMALEKQIEKLPNVTSADFISREEAMGTFSEQHADEAILQGLDAQIFRHRYAIHVADLKQQGETAKRVENIPGVAWVRVYEEISNGFITVRNIASVVCIALIAILFVVSVFIISNTIKLTTFDRRDEIAIMKMVGATNGFIRWPFVYEGLMIGLLGAVIAFALQWLLYEAVAKGVDSSDVMQLVQIVDFESMWKPVAAAFGGTGLLVGVGGSLTAIRRFLQV